MQNLIFPLELLIGASLAAMLWAPFLITPLRKYAGKKISKEDRPLIYDIHQSKIGTPSMGGLLFILNTILFSIFLDWGWPVAIGFITLGLFASLGFIDDYLGTYGKKVGFRWWQKFGLQIIAASLVAWLLYDHLPQVAVVETFIWGEQDFGLWSVPFITFVMVATANAVNITDGLDGLATGLSIFSLITLLAISLYLGQTTNLALYATNAEFIAIFIGSLVAFLWFNIFPARIFMGDVGSMTIGAMFTYFAAITNTLWLIPIIGALFVLELLSSLIQLISLKYFNYRVFKLSPLHHHYEAKGWHEMQVVMRMWLIGVMTGLLGLLIFFVRLS